MLLDIAALKGVQWLELGTVITPDDLDAAADRQGVTVGAGDILLFRTGWRRKFIEEADAKAFMAGEPGLGQACCDCLHDRDVAADCAADGVWEFLFVAPPLKVTRGVGSPINPLAMK